MELAGSTRYRRVCLVKHISRGFRRSTTRVFALCLVCRRVPEAPVNFSLLSGQELGSLLLPRRLPSQESRYYTVFQFEREALSRTPR